MDQSGMTPWRRAVIAAVALAWVAAVIVVERQARHEADSRQDVLATQAALLVDGTASASVSAMAGAGGLVNIRGEVDPDSFRAYAREVVDVSPINALAFEPVVTQQERAEFEAELGQPIVDRRDGEMVPAGERPVYYPVQAVAPRTTATQTVLGFDLLADPVRGTAAVEARDTGRTVLTEPVRATSSGEVSYFVVKPLYRAGLPTDTVAERQEAHVGFISTVYPGSNLTELLAEELPSGSRFSLRDGEAPLASSRKAPDGGSVEMLDVADREWTLVVQDGRAADRTLVLTVLAFGALLLGGLVLYFRRARQHEEEIRRADQVISSTADVAQALAAAGSVEEVDLVIRHQLPGVLSAKGASLGIVDRDRGVLRLSASPGIDADVTARWSEIPLDQTVPIVEVVHTGETLFLRTHDDWRAHGTPDVLSDVEAAGLVSAVCLPLTDRHGQVAATLAMSWADEIEFDAPTVDTIRTITELCEYTLDRARSTDQAARSAFQLAQLAAQLATAVTVAEVLEIITSSASTPVGASATSVGLIDPEARVLRTHHGRGVAPDVRQRFTDPPLSAPLAFTDAARTGLMVLLGDYDAFTERYPESAGSTSSLGFGARAALPMRDSEGVVVGALVHAWARPRVFDETIVSNLLTINDMAAQALERAHLSESEHRVVTTLQDSLLTSMPEAPGLDIAARYLPSVADIGMGGDWYDVFALDDHRYALIVGDVAGHGITAVGDMAQLHAVLGALVRLGSPLGEVFSQATILLQSSDRNPTASSLLAIVDAREGSISYAVAGHPPPLVRMPDGEVVCLWAGRQPILGITVEAAEGADHPFPPGATLVAYTDGLIERRGEPIDTSIDRLRDHLRGAPEGAAAVADHLLEQSLHGYDPADDIALVVIRHEP